MCHPGSVLAPNALRRLRAKFATTEDAVNAGARGAVGIDLSRPLSLRNERECLAALKAALLAKLHTYPTAPDADADHLENATAPWERYALATILGEKHILLAQLLKCEDQSRIIGR